MGRPDRDVLARRGAEAVGAHRARPGRHGHRLHVRLLHVHGHGHVRGLRVLRARARSATTSARAGPPTAATSSSTRTAGCCPRATCTASTTTTRRCCSCAATPATARSTTPNLALVTAGAGPYGGAIVYGGPAVNAVDHARRYPAAAGPDFDTDGFWKATADGQLAMCRCRDLRAVAAAAARTVPARARGPTASNRSAARAPCTPSSCSANRRSVGYFDQVPYAVALVELDEQPGLRLASRLAGIDAHDVDIGIRVQAEIEALPGGNYHIPIFRPVPATVRVARTPCTRPALAVGNNRWLRETIGVRSTLGCHRGGPEGVGRAALRPRPLRAVGRREGRP